MFIDSLTQRQMRDLIRFIGYGSKPIKIAEKFFPEKKKGYVKYTVKIKEYFWNKVMAYNYPKERKKYTEISAEIWCDLPVWARQIPDEVIKEVCKE